MRKTAREKRDQQELQDGRNWVQLVARVRLCSTYAEAFRVVSRGPDTGRVGALANFLRGGWPTRGNTSPFEIEEDEKLYEELRKTLTGEPIGF